MTTEEDGPWSTRLRGRVSLDDQRWSEGVGPARAGRGLPRPEVGASAGPRRRTDVLMRSAASSTVNSWSALLMVTLPSRLPSNCRWLPGLGVWLR